jgi:hypothetical protein
LGTKKKGIGVLLAALLLFSAMPLPALAAAPAGIMPLWDNIFSITMSLTISSGTASCSGSIIAEPGTTGITATFYLERKKANQSFVEITNWPDRCSNTLTLSFTETYPVSSGYTYRLRCDAIVTKGGVDEYVTVYSGEKAA